MVSLAWWRASADAQLTPLQVVKDRLRKTRLELDDAFPSWRAPHDTDPTDFLYHDARREFFVSAQVILGNAQLSYTFIRDQLSDEQWWAVKAGEFGPAMAEEALREHASIVKFYTVHALAVATEEALRAIVRAGQPFTSPPTAEFASVVAARPQDHRTRRVRAAF